jgi:uncharacterized RmlC-like cupin family protein
MRPHAERWRPKQSPRVTAREHSSSSAAVRSQAANFARERVKNARLATSVVTVQRAALARTHLTDAHALHH